MTRPHSLDDLRRLWPQWNTVDEAGCWIWQRGTTDDGYGIMRARVLRANNQPIRAHIASVLLFGGEIAEGEHVHHRCGKTLCTNFDHLEVLSAGEHAKQPKRRYNNGRTKGAR